MKKLCFLCLPFLFAVHSYGAVGIKITEILFANSQFPDADGDHFPWVELRNFSMDTLLTDDYFLTDNINAPSTWRLPSLSINPGEYVIIWFSGKNKIDSLGDIHLDATLALTAKTIGLYNQAEGHFDDVFSVEFLPAMDQSIGRFPEVNDEWILYSPELATPGDKNAYPGRWQQLAARTSFTPRDNNPNAALTYKNQLWLLAGETRDEYGVWTPVTDIWKSSDGIKWEMVNPAGPYRHISSFVVFKDRMWAFDENAYSSADGRKWTKRASNIPFKPFYSRVIQFRDHLINVTEKTVHKSLDGSSWQQITDNAPWEARELFHLIAFKDTLWLLGGVSNYYTDSTIHYNDIWCSVDGSEWSLVTDNAPWPGRLWPTVMVYDDKLWLMGGWNYYYDQGYFSHYGNFNDVWVYTYGGEWQKFETPATWSNRHAMYSLVHKDQLILFAGYGGGGIANLYNDVWKLDLREVPVVEIDRKRLTYGDGPFQLVEGQLPVRYFTGKNEVIFADNDENICIRGAGTASVLIVQAGNKRYYPYDTIVDVQVAKKKLKVSVDSFELEFRSLIPEFKIKYNGFVYQDNEDSLSSRPRAYTTANEFSPVGEYPIVIEATSDLNYEFVTQDGTLTIYRRSILGVYPVPSTGILHLSTDFRLSSNAKLDITNVSGQIVMQLFLDKNVNKFTFDFSNLPKGIYYFTLHDGTFVGDGRFIIH